jgi:hypothetical protein
MRDSILGPNREGDLPIEDEEDLPMRPAHSLPRRRGRPRKIDQGSSINGGDDGDNNDAGDDGDDDDFDLEPLLALPLAERRKVLDSLSSDEKTKFYGAMIRRHADFEKREAEKIHEMAKREYEIHDRVFALLSPDEQEKWLKTPAWDLLDGKIDKQLGDRYEELSNRERIKFDKELANRERAKSVKNQELEKELEKKEPEEMAKKDDIASMVGKELLNSYKAAAKDMAVSQIDPTVSPLASVANTISAKTVGDLATQFPTINMRIKRRNPTNMRWEIIPGPRGIDPKAITEPGALEDLILNWSGGGEYDIELAAPGTKGTVPISFTIDAPPIPTPAFRGGTHVSSYPAQQDPIVKYAAQGQNMVNQQQQQEQGGLLRLVEQMLAMQLAQTIGPRQDVAPSREIEELKRQTTELQAQLRASEDRARADRERSEMTQRLDDISRRVDAASQAKVDPLVTLLTAFAPIAPALLAKGDTAAQTTANMMQAILNQQQQSSNTTIELFKAMSNKPEVEERFAALVGTMGNMSANTMAMVTQVIQAGLLEKGGDSPITQIISQVIGEAADVAKTVFASGAFGGGSQSMPMLEAPAATTTTLPPLPPPSRPMPAALSAHVVPTPVDGPIGEIIDADDTENENENENENVPEESIETAVPVEEPVNENNTYDLMRDAAFREILMRIRNNGDVRDVAVRLYKHGHVIDPTSGHPVAKAWFTDPQHAGRGIMTQLGVEPARIEEIVAAIEALTQHLAIGRELNDYTPTKRNRESRRIPATSATSTPLGEHFDAATIQRVSTVVPAPPVEGIDQPPIVEAATTAIVES